MNHIKTVAVVLLITALPIAPAAFAWERGHEDHDQGERHDRERDRDHDYPGQRWHHYQYCHNDRHDYDDRYRHSRYDHDYGYRPGIVLPLPAFPVIVINRNLREAPIGWNHR
jgi:hypothetical protein